MFRSVTLSALVVVSCVAVSGCRAAALVIAANGQANAIIVVSPEAKDAEKHVADDLAKYIGLMCGATPAIANTPEAVATALAGQAPVLLVGSEALRVGGEPLERALAGVAKADPVIWADAIVLRRDGNRVYLAGSNDASHYFAVAELLRQWGCRWYIPTEFGECIPERDRLEIGALDIAYGPPFEWRGGGWAAWHGDTTGAGEFQARNMMHSGPFWSGHHMGEYVGDLGSIFSIPLAEEATAQHVAKKIEDRFAAGHAISLGMNDGAYESDSEVDAKLRANLYDKYFQGQQLADNFMAFYNNVARILLEKYPDSKSRIGFYGYVNMTIPPQRKCVAEEPLVVWLAPIDIDPIHGMDDPRSPMKQEFKGMMYRWAEIMQGRVVIYDYDQTMLVWRDIPNPSHQAFRQDIKHYRDAGILGFHTEGRSAYATTFLNYYLRGRLMWDPDVDVHALLAEFYPKFYGPAAEPMRRYWSAIYRAWEETIVAEHEFFVIPAIYTQELVEELRVDLQQARTAVAPLRARDEEGLSRNERLYLKRMVFTELSFQIIDQYTAMLRAAATNADYAPAAAAGDVAVAAREKLSELGWTGRTSPPSSGIFTATTFEALGTGGSSYPWLPGEVKYYHELVELTDGTRGRMITRLPLEWAFRRDPNDTGLASGFGYTKPDLTYWNANKQRYATPEARKDYPIAEWEMLRTDLYSQAQGVLCPDWQPFTGFMWYKTDVELTAGQVDGKVHIFFPGLFSEAWLYANGYLIAHRIEPHMQWLTADYRFKWDVDISDHLKPGNNTLTVRVHNAHRNGGMFRRPFLYQPVEP